MVIGVCGHICLFLLYLLYYGLYEMQVNFKYKDACFLKQYCIIVLMSEVVFILRLILNVQERLGVL